MTTYTSILQDHVSLFQMKDFISSSQGALSQCVYNGKIVETTLSFRHRIE